MTTISNRAVQALINTQKNQRTLQAITLLMDGYSSYRVSKTLGIPSSTVDNIYKTYVRDIFPD